MSTLAPALETLRDLEAERSRLTAEQDQRRADLKACDDRLMALHSEVGDAQRAVLAAAKGEV